MHNDVTLFFLAQGFTTSINQMAGILQTLAMLFCFGGLVGAVIQGFGERSITSMKFGLIIAVVAGLAWIITTTVFKSGGNVGGQNITPQAVN
jgi:hypothetical protein